MKIAIFGLSANPIHVGHTTIAQAVLDNAKVNQVWISPCYDHMFNKKLVSSEHRLNMCYRATRELDNIECSRFEIDEHEKFNGTYEMLKLMEKTYNHEFSFVIGQDNADLLHKWKNYEALINEFSLIIVPRKGYISQKNQYNDQGKSFVHLSESLIPEVSSTMIRSYLETGHISKIEHLLHPNVLDYIREHILYKE